MTGANSFRCFSSNGLAYSADVSLERSSATKFEALSSYKIDSITNLRSTKNSSLMYHKTLIAFKQLLTAFFITMQQFE